MTADSQTRLEKMQLSLKDESSPTNTTTNAANLEHHKIKKPRYIRSKQDSVLLCDRIIQEMLQAERFYSPASPNYMQQVRTET